jgi:predicted small secreted protein
MDFAGGMDEMKIRKSAMGARTVAAFGVAVLAFTLTGCATVKGMGRDITSVGQASEDAINGK